MSAPDGGGGKAEEAVRAFFLKAGYFATRGLKFRYDGEDVTDVDVWAFGRGSPTHRERVVVDCKYKIKGAHGFERILWAEGLRRTLYAEHAVVATTDGRQQLRTFAARFQIRLMGPEMLEQLIAENAQSPRFSEEEFLELVIPPHDKLAGNFKSRLDHAKSGLVSLDFDAVNRHLNDLRDHAEESTKVVNRSAVARLFYLSASYLLVTLDFIMRDAAFLSEDRVRERIDDGIRFGSRGRASAMGLLEAVGTRKKRAEVERAVESIPAELLTDFLARHDATGSLFDTAIALEAAAYNRTFVPVAELPISAQGVIGVVMDFHRIDRHVIFGIT